MAAPEYVPRSPDQRTKVYESPPWRPEPWLPVRPGELDGPQPRGGQFGYQGPDQGYALRLARQFDDRLVLQPGEHRDDVVHGACAVALKRASIFGRAPVVHDLTVAFTVWGFLGDAPDEQVHARRPLFEEAASPHGYDVRRLLAALVPEATLRLAPDEVARRAAADWRSVLDGDRFRQAMTAPAAPAVAAAADREASAPPVGAGPALATPPGPAADESTSARPGPADAPAAEPAAAPDTSRDVDAQGGDEAPEHDPSARNLPARDDTGGGEVAEPEQPQPPGSSLFSRDDEVRGDESSTPARRRRRRDLDQG